MGRGSGPAGRASTYPAPGATEYLSLEDLLDLVNALGAGPVRDLGLLDSACHRPRASFFGQEAYPTLTGKAAALMHSPWLATDASAARQQAARLAGPGGVVLANQRLHTGFDRRRGVRSDHVRGRRPARRRRDPAAASNRASTPVTIKSQHSRSREIAYPLLPRTERSPDTCPGTVAIHASSGILSGQLMRG